MRTLKRWFCLRCGAVVDVAGDGAICHGSLDAPHARAAMEDRGETHRSAPLGRICIDVDRGGGRLGRPVTEASLSAALADVKKVVDDEANGMQIGDVYEVEHKTRGVFEAIILDDTPGAFVTLEVCPGSYARSVGGGPIFNPGEQFRVVREFCKFTFLRKKRPSARPAGRVMR